jgi:hypothetical protein
MNQTFVFITHKEKKDEIHFFALFFSPLPLSLFKYTSNDIRNRVHYFFHLVTSRNNKLYIEKKERKKEEMKQYEMWKRK